MVVVKAKKTRSRRGGRPVGDPQDKRTERIAIRAHPDLVEELNIVARAQGFVRSVLIERALIDLVNRHYGRQVVDAIGRYVDYPGQTVFDHRGRPVGPTPAPASHSPMPHSETGGITDHPSRRLRPPKK